MEALKAFERSYALKPTASALFNIGMCFKALVRYVESIDTLRKYIAHPKAEPEVVGDAQAAVDEMESLIGYVAIKGAPIESEVHVNGKTAALTPLAAPLRLDPNNLNIIRVTKAGYLPFVKEISIEPGEKVEIEAALVKERSTLKVVCVGGDAAVSIDDTPAVPCPCEREMAPGQHMVRVSLPGQKDFLDGVEVVPGQTAMVTAIFNTEADPVRSIDRTSRPFIISSVVAGILGLGSAAVSAVYGYKYKEVLRVGTAAANRYNNDKSTDVNRELSIYNQAEKDRLRYQKGIVIGLVGAGALLSTGAVLLGTGWKKRRKTKEVSVVLLPSGMAIGF